MCQSCDVWEALRRLDFVRRRALRPRLLALGLTLGEGQPRILNRLLRRGVPMTQRELADACWLDTATLSRTLDRMEAAGLLRRMPDGESRRSYRIVLTEAGREKAAQMVHAGLVSVNHREADSVSHRVNEGDIISIRRYGRFIVDMLGPVTKKGRLSVKCRKYI